MAAVSEGPIPFNSWNLENMQTSSSPADAVIFAGLCLVMGLACRRFLCGSKVPYTVVLLVLGVGIGFFEHAFSHQMGKLGDGIRLWENIDADLLLAAFLPVLLFEGSFLMEVHQVKRCMIQMLLVAGPGVLISTFCIGSALKLSFPYNWTWKISLLLGAILSATDPVAVVASMKELGVSKKMSTIIEGESMINDGVSMVVYQLFFKMVLGQKFGWAGIIKFFSLASVGSVAIGIAFGMASVFWLGFVYNDTVTNISLTLAVSYIAYFVAQELANVSGILTVVTLGIYFAAVGKTKFKAGQWKSLEEFWGIIAYIYNTLIFILSGVIIARGVLNVDNLTVNHGLSWGYLFLLYAFVQVSRIIVVVTLYPFLRSFGYGLDWKEAILLAWSGLRGAVSLSLALAVKSGSTSSVHLSAETGVLFVFFTGGVMFLTIIVNGSTTQFLLYLFGMDQLSAIETFMLDYTKYKLLNKAQEDYESLGSDELGSVDWNTIKSYMMCINNLSGEGVHSIIVPVVDENWKSVEIRAMRVRLLKATKATYRNMLDEGKITPAVADILTQLVDQAIDLSSEGPVSNWNCLAHHLDFSKSYRYLQTTIPQKIVRYMMLEKLQFACYVSVAFIHAHKKARRQLHEFIGDNEITLVVSNESEEEEERARKYLDDMAASFPQVLVTVKTRQVTHTMLNGLADYLENIGSDGLLEEKVVLRVQEMIEGDLERISKTSLKIQNPTLKDVLRGHPCLRNIPSKLCEELQGAADEVIKPYGVTLYKEGSNPKGIWIVLNGLIKVGKLPENGKIFTFSQGSVLGLYEVLVGKPCICDMITDSVVLCLYLKSEILLSLLESSPGIDRFFWQESAITLAKTLLPQVFMKISINELRVLIAENSTMSTYISGEIIEIPNNFCCLLLEGSLRPDYGKAELVLSPGVLLPPQHADQNLSNTQISGDYCTLEISIEVTAMLETTSLEIEARLHTSYPPKPTIREPLGLGRPYISDSAICIHISLLDIKVKNAHNVTTMFCGSLYEEIQRRNQRFAKEATTPP